MQKREGRLLRYIQETEKYGSPIPLDDTLHRFSLASPDADLLQAYGIDGVQLYPKTDSRPSVMQIEWPPEDCKSVCFSIVKVNRHSYRVLQQLVWIGPRQIRLTMAGEIDEHYDILRMVRNSYFIFFPLMLTASIVGGLALGARALQPVDRMTRAVHTISIRDLRQRLPVPVTGDEIQRLAETWNGVLGRLESAVGKLTQFTSDISHDLRTTVTVMLSTAELALRRERTGDEYRNALRTIVLECQATTILLDDLLAAARADMVEQNIELAPVDLSATVREACEQSRSTAEIKQQDLQFVLESEMWVLGDSSMLRRLVMILLDNALKYTPEHGSIRVSLSGRRAGIAL